MDRYPDDWTLFTPTFAAAGDEIGQPVGICPTTQGIASRQLLISTQTRNVLVPTTVTILSSPREKELRTGKTIRRGWLWLKRRRRLRSTSGLKTRDHVMKAHRSSCGPDRLYHSHRTTFFLHNKQPFNLVDLLFGFDLTSLPQRPRSAGGGRLVSEPRSQTFFACLWLPQYNQSEADSHEFFADLGH